jgi:2-polyprenyl-6-methoxyphenol hydroxylase-like FAD-dependent oxidoreductase
VKVIVAGAGIAGLCAAIGLRRAGIDVTVLEKRQDPRELAFGGGMTLWNNATRALQELGLGELVEPIGAPVEVAEWYTTRNGGALIARWPVGDVGRELGAPVLCVRRRNLQSVLTDAYGAESVRLGVACTGFAEERGGVVARLSDGTEERGDVVVGADGLSSAVRAQLVGLPKPRYAGYGVWFGTTEETTGERVWREIDGPGRRFVFFPVDGGRIYWACIANAAEEDVLQAGGAELPGEKEKLLAQYAGWPEPVEPIIRGTEDREIFRRPIVDRRPLRRWGRGRVTLTGDAAHPITINLGQGACLAIEDALALTKALTAGGEVVAALRSYEARRIARTASFVRRARAIGAMGRWKRPAACRARDAVAARVLPRVVFRQHVKDMAVEL